jgi:hypothetical protein
MEMEECREDSWKEGKEGICVEELRTGCKGRVNKGRWKGEEWREGMLKRGKRGG